MKILVTGGAGFVGSHVADAFLAAGHEVIIVDNLFSGKLENVNRASRFYRADITGPEVLEIVNHHQPDAICHQAARVDVRASMSQPLEFAHTNVIGSLNLLEAARRCGVGRFIYAQTGGCVYGEPKELPSPETHPIQPVEPYGVSKYLLELYLSAYARHYGLTYVVLRYPNVYGPRQNSSGEAGVVSIFARQMLVGGTPVINGTGEQVRDYVYVKDVAAANVVALSRGDNDVFNVGSGRGRSVLEVYAALKSVTGFGGEATFGPPRPGEVSASVLDSSKAARTLGWSATTDFTLGLSETVEDVRRQLAATR